MFNFVIKNLNNLINLFGLYIILIIFLDAFQKDYFTFLDFDLTVIYNSIQVISQENQTYKDHPAFSQFFFYGLFYKLYGLFNPSFPLDLDNLLNENDVDYYLQKFYILSRVVNTIFCLLFFVYIKKILFFFQINRFYIFISLLFTLTTTGFVLNAIILRADIIALSLFLISMYYLLDFIKNNKKYKLFIFSFCLIFSLLAKVQIIFFYLFLFIFIVFYLANIKKITGNLKKDKFIIYKFLFIFILLSSYLTLQIFLNFRYEVDFRTYNFIDLAFYSSFLLLFLSIIFIYFKDDKTFFLFYLLDLFLLIIYYSSLTFLIIFLLSYINFIKFDYSLILTFTNPISLMMMSAPSSVIMGENLIQNIIEIFKISFSAFSLTKTESNSFSFEENNVIILFFVSILLFLFQVKNFKKNKKNFIYCILFSFFFIFLILLFNLRWIPIDEIYYWPIYMILTGLVISSFDQKFIPYLNIFLLLFFLNINFKNKNDIHEVIYAKSNIELVCVDSGLRSFYMVWSPKLNEDFFIKICNKKNIKYY